MPHSTQLPDELTPRSGRRTCTLFVQHICTKRDLSYLQLHFFEYREWLRQESNLPGHPLGWADLCPAPASHVPGGIHLPCRKASENADHSWGISLCLRRKICRACACRLCCGFLFGYDPFWINFMIYPHNLFIQNARMRF